MRYHSYWCGVVQHGGAVRSTSSSRSTGSSSSSRSSHSSDSRRDAVRAAMVPFSPSADEADRRARPLDIDIDIDIDTTFGWRGHRACGAEWSAVQRIRMECRDLEWNWVGWTCAEWCFVAWVFWRRHRYVWGKVVWHFSFFVSEAGFFSSSLSDGIRPTGASGARPLPLCGNAVFL